MPIQRLKDFAVGQRANPDDVDAEFDNLVGAYNSLETKVNNTYDKATIDTKINNATATTTVLSGTAFPVDTFNTGQLFWRSDQKQMYAYDTSTNTWLALVPDEWLDRIERLEYDQYLSWMEQYYQSKLDDNQLTNLRGMRIFPFDKTDNPDGSYNWVNLLSYSASPVANSGGTGQQYGDSYNGYFTSGYRQITAPSGWLEFDVYGDRIVICYTKRSNFGIMDVLIDGVKVDTIDLYAASGGPYLVKTYTTTPGAHKLRFVRTETKNASASAYDVAFNGALFYHSNSANVNTAYEKSSKLLIAGRPVNTLANDFIAGTFLGDGTVSTNAAQVIPSLVGVQTGVAWSSPILQVAGAAGGANKTVDFNFFFNTPVQIDKLDIKAVAGGNVAMNATAQVQGVWVTDDFVNWTSVGAVQNIANNATLFANGSGSGEAFTYPDENAGAALTYPFTARTVRGMRIRFYLATTSTTTTDTLKLLVQEFKLNCAPITANQYHYKTTVADTFEPSYSHRIFISSLYPDKLGLKVTNNGVDWVVPTLVQTATDPRFTQYQETTYDVTFPAAGSKCGLKFDFDSAQNTVGNEVKRAGIILK